MFYLGFLHWGSYVRMADSFLWAVFVGYNYYTSSVWEIWSFPSFSTLWNCRTEFIGSGGLIAGLPWWLSHKEPTCNAGGLGSIPGSGRSPGEGNGNLLQYPCLENSADRLQRSLAGYSPWGHKRVGYDLALNNNKQQKCDKISLWKHLHLVFWRVALCSFLLFILL